MNFKRTSAAVVATAFGIALGAGTAFAADGTIPCGTPAVDAVYQTVVTPAVPAVTHTEYLWQLTTVQVEYKWQLKVIDQAAQDAVYETIHHEAVYRTVVVTPAQAAYDEQVLVTPAVVEYEFRNKSGQTRWETDPLWNANGNPSSQGWVGTGAQNVLTPAVYDVIHHEAVAEVTAEELVTAAWDELKLVTPAVEEQSHYEEKWSLASPGEGWLNTGVTRQLEPTVETRWSVASPGEGWVNTQQSKTVIDQVEVPATSTVVVVTPATPAGEPCPPPVVVEPPVVVAPPKPVVNPVVTTPAKPAAKPASAIPQAAPVQAAPVQAAAAPATLAHTGSDLMLLWLGAGMLVAGAGLTAGYRKASGVN